MKIVDNLLTFLKSKRTWLGIILPLLLLWLIVYACTSRVPIFPKSYTIARNVNWYPLQLMSRERSFLGFIDDLMVAVAKEGGFKYDWIETGPTHLMEGLDDGSYDAVLIFGRPTFSTKEKYDLSSLIYETGPVLIVPTNSTIHSLDDLDGKIVGIPSGMSFIFTSTMKNTETNYFLSSFDNMSKALDALVNNKIDAVVMEVIPAHTYIQTFYPDKLKIISHPLTDEGLRLVALKNWRSERLIKKFNEGLKKIKENNTYRDLLDKWQIVDPEQYPVEHGNIPKQL